MLFSGRQHALRLIAYETCSEIQIFNIHVLCTVEECEKRNIERGDRRLGLSEWHNERMINIPYFLEIDTLSKSSYDCATEIINKIEALLALEESNSQ